jgi:hypothetical protein
MDEDKDVERRLDAMYGSLRPRAGFEAELWGRIQARRSWNRRLAAWLQPGLRLAPALAAFLVLAIGVGFLATRAHIGGGGLTTTSEQSGGAARNSEQAGPGFGVLPSLPGANNGNFAAPADAGTIAPATGQAAAGSFRFVGRLPELPGSLPVYRYDEPTPSARSAAAARLTQRTGLRIQVEPSRPNSEPQFVVRGLEAQASPPSLLATAEAFVTGHMLTPGYVFKVTVPAGGQSVVYARQFPVAGTSVPVARPTGGLAGLAVQVQGNLVVGASGPLELPLDTVQYPTRPPADLLAAAGVQVAPAGSPQPVLDHAQVVYVVVVSGAHGYYEPEMLLTGPAGTVLAPIVSASWLSG